MRDSSGHNLTRGAIRKTRTSDVAPAMRRAANDFHDPTARELPVDSPRDHRFSAIWQALRDESRTELLSIARANDPTHATPELIADIRRNGGMIVRPPWTPEQSVSQSEVIPMDFLNWLNRSLGERDQPQ